MKTFEDIKQEFISAFAQQEATEEAYKKQANDARKAAIRYQKIAARKMTEYHKLFSKSFIDDVNWVDSLVKPLLREIQFLTGLDFYDYAKKRCSNTSGLRCEYWIFAHDDNGKCIASLCFTPGSVKEGEIYIDTGEQSGHYAAGTIGEINGMNNKSEKVESIETVIENLKRRYPELNIK